MLWCYIRLYNMPTLTLPLTPWKAKVIDGITKELKKLPNLTTLLRRELGAWQNEEGFPFR